MEKKVYDSPLTEVIKVNLSASILTGSTTEDDTPMPDPNQPGAPKRTPYMF